MLIGRVIGRVVATIKAEGLEGARLLLVEPLDEKGQVKGPAIVACDATRTAGPGDLVHYEGGREAALALDPWFVPVDHTIMGIIDRLQIRGEERAGLTDAPAAPEVAPARAPAAPPAADAPPRKADTPGTASRRRNPPRSGGRST